jgi:hypothetical protein
MGFLGALCGIPLCSLRLPAEAASVQAGETAFEVL